MPVNSHRMDTPVVLVIFKRPQFTARVLEMLAQVKPRQLFVVADGPRLDRPGEEEACAAARAVIDRVNWDCEVRKDYSEINLGAAGRVSSGLNWVFRHVEEAIVLEDDCLPHPSFFPFCTELLAKYRDDERVMHIAGSTYRAGEIDTPYSYFFSVMNGCWGWATWRRAWQYFDASATLWPELKQTSWLADILEHPSAVRYWAGTFDIAHERKGDLSGAGYWDVLWTFACWANSGLAITPRSNLVTNVGCGADATHMHWEDDPIGNIPLTEIRFPLDHPPNVLMLREADRDFIHKVILPRTEQPRPSALRSLAARVAPQFAKQAYRRASSALGMSPAGTQTR